MANEHEKARSGLDHRNRAASHPLVTKRDVSKLCTTVSLNKNDSGGPLALPHIVAEMPRGVRDFTRIELGEWQGYLTFSARDWFTTECGSNPTPKGLTMGVERLPEFVEHLQEALRLARLHGLLKGREAGR